MKKLMVSSYMACAYVAAMTAGCDGSQPPISASGAMPQSHPVAPLANRSGSWMLPEATSEALLYVVSIDRNVYVISYPGGKLVGMITDIDGAQGVCTDAAGDIYITAFWTQNVLEYRHGGTTPIAHLGDFGYHPLGYAVDPTTGNLAVANQSSMSDGGNVAIYTGAVGKPTDYSVFSTAWCAYDDMGDLFVDAFQGNAVAELASGSQKFINISLNIPSSAGLQWDGQYLAIVAPSSNVVYRVAVSGSLGTVVGTVKFKGLIASLGYDFVFNAKSIVMPFAPKKDDFAKLGVWKYPRGGQVVRELHPSGGIQYYSIALSK